MPLIPRLVTVKDQYSTRQVYVLPPTFYIHPSVVHRPFLTVKIDGRYN